jgi:hypothetical protein
MSDTARGGPAPEPAAFWAWVWSAVRPALGWVLAGTGGLLIAVGWFGVSGNALPARQLPYLVSGGIGGLALVTLGAVLLAGQDVRRELVRLDRLEARVDELITLLTEAASQPEAFPPVVDLPQQSARPGEERVASRRGGSFHRTDCPLVTGKPDLRRVAAGAAHSEGLRACRVCDPLPSAAS